MKYTVNFDNGKFLGHYRRVVREYPDAEIFPNKHAAEKAALKMNLPSTVVPVEV